MDTLTPEHLESLKIGLQHSNSDVRMAAFSVICHVKKKGILPTVQELSLVHDYIQNSITSDEAAFRQVNNVLS